MEGSGHVLEVSLFDCGIAFRYGVRVVGKRSSAGRSFDEPRFEHITQAVGLLRRSLLTQKVFLFLEENDGAVELTHLPVGHFRRGIDEHLLLRNRHLIPAHLERLRGWPRIGRFHACACRQTRASL